MVSKTTRPSLVDLSRFTLERHVSKALESAWLISSGRPLNGGHLLKSALRLTSYQSGAFAKLRSLLRQEVNRRPTESKRPPPLDLDAVSFDRPLLESFFVAESFLETGKNIWGRDYITLALLSRGDDSLSELASESGTTIDMVRNDWLEYVRESGQHRKPLEWEQWWRTAGFSIPGDTRTEPVSTAYLLTWNPAIFPVSKIEKYVTQLEKNGFVEFGWSTGQRRTIDAGGRIFLLQQGAGQRGLVGVGEVTGEVKEVPHWRKELQEKGKKSHIVPVRWFALAVIPFVERSSLVSITGEESLWSTRTGGISLTPELTGKLESIWPVAWERHRHGLDTGPLIELESKNLIAQFNADRGADDDSLNISQYVSAFARVMASRALTPPLSIGLFGDWGSGKTYFMDQLHDKIESLSSDDNDARDLYWPRICQIKFNAWHYAETDLWASLVSTIFNELRVYLDGPKEDADEFNKLLNQLEIASALREETKRQLKKAKELVDQAKTRVTEAGNNLGNLKPAKPMSDDALRKVLRASVIEASGESKEELIKLIDTAAELSGSSRLADAAENLKSTAATVQDTRVLFQETRALASRAGFWWRILSAAKFYKTRGFKWIVTLAVAIPVVFIALEALLKIGLSWVGLLTEVLVVGGTIVNLARSSLAKAGPVFDRLDALQATIEGQIEDAKTADRRAYEDRLRQAQTDRDAAEERLIRAQSDLEATEAREENAQKALRESTSQVRLGRFIRERSERADYEKYLGLIAMIHRDFQQLSNLMEKARADEADPKLPRVDRIILYIDDLDRCYPPERVVRVLEAVHLLLFFPLFVVVVGVDSRWVSRALNNHYQDMLADESIRVEEAGEHGLQRAPADSQDFLEKIFQVPFWLRKMDPSAVKRMISNLITPDEVESVPKTDTDEFSTYDESDEEELAMLEPAGEKSPIPSNDKLSRAAARHITAEAESAMVFADEPLIPPTEGLLIGEAELSFMNEVAPLMPRTPRSVKRFVNIYRLYKAALSTEGIGRFLGTQDRPGNFRAVQVLLALVTGTPRFAQAVISAIDDAADAKEKGDMRLSNLVDNFELEDETWETTIDALREFAQGDNDLQLKALREVSPLVGRYSVHHMVSRVPGESALG